MADEEDQACGVLDRLDDRTVVQNRLHAALSSGHMWLARERYRDSLAIHRLSHVASDTRHMHSQVRVAITNQMTMTPPSDQGQTTADRDARPGDARLTLHMRKLHESEFAHRELDGRDAGHVSHVADEGVRRRRRSPQPRPTRNHKQMPAQEEARVRRGDAALPLGMPSTEVREAIKCFQRAIDDAIELAMVSSRVCPNDA